MYYLPRFLFTIFACSLSLAFSHLSAQEQLGNKIPAATGSDGAGTAVSISADGNTMALSSPLYDGDGHVRVFTWSTISWTQKGNDILGIPGDKRFGFDISMSNDGNTIAIGSPFTSSGGQVHVFDWIIDQWVQRGSDILGESYGDGFGRAVDMNGDGNRVAIGSPDNDDSGFRGRVKVYEWNGSQWIQMGENMDGPTFGDDYGHALSLNDNGTTLIIGSPLAGAGKVEVMQWNGLSWSQKGADIDGENSGEQLGFAVDISADGNEIVIGAPKHHLDGTTFNVGKAMSYNWTGSNWEIGLEVEGLEANDEMGAAVSINDAGDVIAVGTPGTAAGGTVHTYKVFQDQWFLRGEEMHAEDAFDDFGAALDFSSDGKDLVIGAPLASLNSGAAYVYGPCWNSEFDSEISACGFYEDPNGDIYTTSGSFTYEIDDGFVCSDLINLTLSIDAIDSTFFSGSGCQSFYVEEWDETFTTGGIHKRIFTNVAGCDSVVSLDLDLTTINLQVIYEGGQFTAVETMGDSYQWFDCTNQEPIAGETSPSLAILSTGFYSVIITKGNCVDTTECSSIASSQEILDIENAIQIYPNPSSGNFVIDISEMEIPNAQVEIFDLNGRMILRKELGMVEEVDLGGEPEGVYVVKIKTEKRSWGKRVVLVKE